MKKTKSIIWGVVAIVVGILFVLKNTDILNIDVFFDGWWTLFIIIPSLVDLVTERKLDNLIWLGLGVVLLLACLDVISFGLIAKLIVPAIVIIIGIKLIVNGVRGDKAREIFEKHEREADGKGESCFAAFSENKIDFTARAFEAAELCAVFGSVKCDISGASIVSDCAIRATAVFGGIDVIAPKDVNIKINSTSIFGGVEKKIETNPDAPVTLHINAICIFGGVDVK